MVAIDFQSGKNPHDNIAAKYNHYPYAEELSKLAFFLLS